MAKINIKKAILGVSSVMALFIVVAGAVYYWSPWPSALMWRYIWDKDGAATNRALEQYVPAGVSAQLNISYDATDTDPKLDVFYPSTVDKNDEVLPTVVWVHGGSWISGSKDYIANYLRILASKGFTTVGVDYSLAPGSTYPTPVKQVNVALGFLSKNAARLHVDPSRFFLAGDSAGAQIAAQVANAITSPSYAADVGIVPTLEPPQLLGVVFHCGMYDTKLARFGRRGVLWSYFGTKDFVNDPRLSQFSVLDHVTSSFPPIFMSAASDDALAPQSYALAKKVGGYGVPLDRLFFPPDSIPKVWHGFQFNLETDAGKLALERSVDFMKTRLQHDRAGGQTAGGG
ncbi:alpha/beta hydrolase [Labrys okinawensis]|uniref:alpha/beta hydrolase n=1 Tax=Labrys okinawensis TaxID=346911 RepID=UPI0039BCE9CB